MSKKILTIDDDVDLTDSIKAWFEARGYAVRAAHSGAEGKKAIRQERPDAIILDVMMDTDADGFNLAYELKGDAATRDIPIVLLSGFTDHLADKAPSFEFVMGRDWPATEYLKKPASLQSIGEAVERVLGS
ncbi:MAG: response regulator [Acidobacteriota bacterium]|jgi:DNA-binding response OmpR family regulator|nr:response regulator [Acidobacteriota bacterium]